MGNQGLKQLAITTLIGLYHVVMLFLGPPAAALILHHAPAHKRDTRDAGLDGHVAAERLAVVAESVSLHQNHAVRP